MTVIEKIILRGFKSFPKRVEIPFGKAFNMFLGPNGSGKSNVCDAICFVMGKSSASELRAKKSANLIYHGSKKTAPSKDAEVIIEFDNSKNTFSINENPVSISRTVKKNGQSTYRINNNVVTRQQVIDLLSSANIDPDGHNIVLQGDIVKFTEMKPDEKREIIENIAGISVYENKKNKCLLELEKVDSKLNEASIILTERETNLKELKKDRDQAIKYKELQNELRDYKATHIHIQKKAKEEKQNELEKRINENQSAISRINKVIEENKKLITSMKNEIRNITNEIEEKGEKEQLILRKEIESIKESIIKSKSRADVCKTELKRIEQRNNTLKKDLEEINVSITANTKEKEKISKSIEQKEMEESALTEEMNKTRKKYNISGFSDMDKLEKNIDELNSNLLNLQEKRQVIIRENDQVEFHLNELKDKLNELKNNKELQELKEKKDYLKKIVEDISKLTTENKALQSELTTARKEIVTTNDELYNMQIRHGTAIENNAIGTAIKKILNLKKKGVYGTIAQLGKVNSKYALALETAAGQKINSIVVEDDQIASDSIKYLKDNRLGTATFLPLNKIKPRITKQIKKEGVEGLAIDLIRFDQKYKNAFSYIFGSTIVVKDVNIARRLGVGSARMVTLDGDLIEQSGAMIGGYRQRRISSFKELDIEKNMQEKEKSIAKLKSLIEHLERKKSKNEEESLSLKETRANTEFDIIKIEKTLGIKIDTTELISKQSSFTKKLNELSTNLKQTELEIQNKMKDINKMKEEKSKLKDRLKDPKITKELEDIEQRKSVIKENIIELKGRISNINAQIKTIYIPEKEKIDKIMKQQEIENQTFLNEVNNLNELLKNRNIELKQKEKKEKDSYSNFKNLALKRNKINDKIQKTETNIIKDEERARTIEHRNNDLSIDRAKIVAETEGLNKEFEQYKEGTIRRNIPIEQLRDKIREFERTLNSVGNVNLRALEIYENIEKEYKQLVEKRNLLLGEKQDVLNMMQEIESKKKDIFMKCYNEINKNFKSIFSHLTTKAEATLQLENPEVPLEAGMDIIVKLPGNKTLDLKSLSGGEKTLTALAFIFSIQEYQPSSFYLLDEVDAALDKRNSEMLSKLIQKYSKRAQYIVISHNDAVITEAENIYGVSMQDGISKIISLKV